MAMVCKRPTSPKKKKSRCCYRAPVKNFVCVTNSQKNSQHQQPIRYVEPFSIASYYQENIKVYPPCKINIFEERNVSSSLFRMLCLRGDIPCQRSFCKAKDNQFGTYLLWKIDPKDLDYCYYLPIFFEGLCDSGFPYHTIACYAIQDLLNADGKKALPVVPQLIIPIKNAFSTKNRGVIAATLRIIQHLCMCVPCAGRGLLPYFQRLLPALNIFYNRNVNKLDCIDYSRVGRLGDIVDDTLKILERYGGSDAYINIKHAIPTYESCVNN